MPDYPYGNPDYPFTTDGCSGGMSALWRVIFRRDPPWEGCCVAHDKLYWRGGDQRDRKVADVQLMNAVSLTNHPWIAMLMYAAVRIGGHPRLPLPWRWGYGWKYRGGYK